MTPKTVKSLLSRTIKVGACNVWQGSTKGSGRRGQARYPSVGYEGKNWGGHRLMYKLAYGEFDLDLHVLHKCDNTLCINPKHLKLGTHTDNMQDKIRKGRDHNQQKTTCLEGHPFSEENTYIRTTGARTCRTCMKQWASEYDARNREKRRLAAIKRYYAMKGVKDGERSFDRVRPAPASSTTT